MENNDKDTEFEEVLDRICELVRNRKNDPRPLFTAATFREFRDSVEKAFEAIDAAMGEVEDGASGHAWHAQKIAEGHAKDDAALAEFHRRLETGYPNDGYPDLAVHAAVAEQARISPALAEFVNVLVEVKSYFNTAGEALLTAFQVIEAGLNQLEDDLAKEADECHTDAAAIPP